MLGEHLEILQTGSLKQITTTSYWKSHGCYNPESFFSTDSPNTLVSHLLHKSDGNTTNTLLQFPMKWNWTGSSHLLLDVINKSHGYRYNVITSRSHASLSCGLYPLLSYCPFGLLLLLLLSSVAFLFLSYHGILSCTLLWHCSSQSFATSHGL